MRLEKLGEFGLIDRIKKAFPLDASVIRGSGDDCAVLAFDRDTHQLFTCDMIVEGVDFRPAEDPYLIGRKALAVSISDIASCGGIPRHAAVSLGLPRRTSVKTVDAMVRGMRDLARSFRINIVGGDISRSGALTLDVSMLGLVEKKNLVLRSGARTGDVIAVSGPLGGSIRGRHLRFLPRVKEARFLVGNFKVNAMIDISDGLIQDLAHILRASKKSAVLYEPLIPVSKDARGLDEALSMGEDFELLFTLPRKEARRLWAFCPDQFLPIGEIAAPGRDGLIRLFDARGRKKRIRLKGYTHF